MDNEAREIESRRLSGVRLQKLDNEPETTFLAFETREGPTFHFHMRTGEMAQLGHALLIEAARVTN